MEIHELNTFSGTPGAGDFLATDNGTDTAKIAIKTITDPLDARIDNIMTSPSPSAEEVTDARLGANGKTYASLGTAIRSQVNDLDSNIGGLIDRTSPIKLKFISGGNDYNMPNPSNNARAYTLMFALHELDRIYLTNNTYEYQLGSASSPFFATSNTIQWWGWTQARYTIPASLDGKYGIILIRKKGATSADISGELAAIADSVRYLSPYDSFVNHGLIGSSYGVTNIAKCVKSGIYRFSSGDRDSLTDLPTGFPQSGGQIIVMPYAFASNSSRIFAVQILYDTGLHEYKRIIDISDPTDPSVFKSWTVGESSKLLGKNVAILGDSISTNGLDGAYPNVPEIKVESADVGVQLSAYLTYYDVQAGLTLGGHTFTSAEIGNEVTFTPSADDVGKCIGLANNYNPASRTVWWEVAMSEFGFNPIPVCWSGASVTSHEGNTDEYKTSYAWHNAQVRKCGIRIAGSMTRIDPDVIIIYRGTNDMTHSPYTRLTEGYFDNYNWQYPNTDEISSGVYGYKEGLCLTIKKLRDRYPNAQIILCTLNVFKRVNVSHFPTNNGINSLPQYNDAIREVADFMGCDVIDFDKDGITFENCYSQGYITDSENYPTHPSDKGHKAMGNKAIADLKAKYNSLT